VLLDLLEVDRVAEPRGLEQVAGVRPEQGISMSLERLHLKWPW